MHDFLFWVIALLTGLSAVSTVLTHNIVRAATWLLFTLAGTSGIFFLLGADLVGAIQLLVYVGGTLVLVVFGVMLTAQGPFIHMKTGGAEWAVSTGVGLLLFGVLAVAALQIRDPEAGRYKLGPKDSKSALVAYGQKDRLVNLSKEHVELQQRFDKGEIDKETYDVERRKLDNAAPRRAPYTDLIGQGLLGKPVGPAHTPAGPTLADPDAGKKKVARAHYLFPFEIVSVHLLVVLIGAAYLARAKRRRVEPVGPGTTPVDGGAGQ